MSAVEKFPVLLSEAEEESSAVPPCFTDEGINVSVPVTKMLSKVWVLARTINTSTSIEAHKPRSRADA